MTTNLVNIVLKSDCRPNVVERGDRIYGTIEITALFIINLISSILRYFILIYRILRSVWQVS